MAETFHDVFVQHMCGRDYVLMIVFSLSALLFLSSFVSLSVVERGSPTFVIAAFNIFGMGGFMFLSGVALLLCRKWE